jgi:hypothetical protein
MSEENKTLSIRDELTEFFLYTTPNGNVRVEIFFYLEMFAPTIFSWIIKSYQFASIGVNRANICSFVAITKQNCFARAFANLMRCSSCI